MVPFRNPRSPMKNLLIILLLAGLAVCVSAGGWLLSRPNPALSEVARLELELKDAKAEITRLKEAMEKQKATASFSRATAPSPTATMNPVSGGKAASASAAATVGNGSAAPGAVKSGANAFRDMMKAPGMKEMVKQQNLAQMEMTFGRLFDAFQLNPEEKENFKQLLAARTGAQTEMGLKLMEENLTPEQRKQITAEYEVAKKTSDEQIRTFLGDEADYKTFQHWEDTQPERMSFEMMGGRAHFSSAGEPLTPDQEQRLVDVMATVRKAPSKLPDLSKPENVWSSNLSDEMVQQQLQKYDRDAQTVAQNAAGFLSAKQLEALAKMQQQMRTMTEAGLKMTSAMMKGGK